MAEDIRDPVFTNTACYCCNFCRDWIQPHWNPCAHCESDEHNEHDCMNGELCQGKCNTPA